MVTNSMKIVNYHDNMKGDFYEKVSFSTGSFAGCQYGRLWNGIIRNDVRVSFLARSTFIIRICLIRTER